MVQKKNYDLLKQADKKKHNYTWNTNMGTTRNVYANAEFKDVRL